MIKYSLQCSNGHSFDGWFKDSATYDSQAESTLLSCPFCADTHVSKAMMSPSLANNAGKKRAARTLPATEAKPQAPVAYTPEQMATIQQMNEVVQKLKKHIQDTCTDVGDNLAEEARKIHYGEKKAEGIYGTASKNDVEELLDEGINVLPAPFLQKPDA
jgi:hypothetical protein